MRDKYPQEQRWRDGLDERERERTQIWMWVNSLKDITRDEAELPGEGASPTPLPPAPLQYVSIATSPDPEGKYCPTQKQRGCVDII